MHSGVSLICTGTSSQRLVPPPAAASTSTPAHRLPLAGPHGAMSLSSSTAHARCRSVGRPASVTGVEEVRTPGDRSGASSTAGRHLSAVDTDPPSRSGAAGRAAPLWRRRLPSTAGDPPHAGRASLESRGASSSCRHATGPGTATTGALPFGVWPRRGHHTRRRCCTRGNSVLREQRGTHVAASNEESGRRGSVRDSPSNFTHTHRKCSSQCSERSLTARRRKFQAVLLQWANV
jgi:hypothetical protein